MRIVVTGGSGFIGGHVARHLREAGHQVVNVDVAGEDAEQIDICDLEKLQDLFRRAKTELVFHIAGLADARRVIEAPIDGVRINITGTTSVLEAARQTAVNRVVLASTCWTGNAMAEGILDETEPFQPNGGGHIYTTTKMASELLMHDYQKLYGLDFTVLRYGIPYGPNMWPGLALRSFLDNALAGKPLTIFGDGSAARRFVFVDDLARAHVLAIQQIASNQVYNLEGMRFVTIKELAETVAQYIPGTEIIYREEPNRVGEFHYYHKLISAQKAFAQLGWEPTVDLEHGVRRTIRWYVDTYFPEKKSLVREPEIRTAQPAEKEANQPAA